MRDKRERGIEKERERERMFYRESVTNHAERVFP
jgi:hypothetical protein